MKRLASIFALAALAGCGVTEKDRAPVTGPPPGTGGAPGTGGVPGTGGTNPTPSGGAGGQSGGPGGTVGSDGSGGTGMKADAALPPDGPPPVMPPLGPPLPPGGPFGAGATKDKVVVFVHIGHSNMAGRATDPADERPYFYDVDPHLWSFHGTNMTIGNMPYLWRPAKEPLSPDSMTGGMAGPGMAILHAAQTFALPDTHVVSVGHGHSGTEGGHCQNYLKGGLLYEIAMGPARAMRGRVTFGGIFTMLGTTERHYAANVQTAFADCMTHVAADMRADLGDPNIPFMMSDFEMEATADTSPTLPYAKIIIAQLRTAQTNITRSALIPTEKISMQDSHHFSMAGHKDWALRGMQIMKNMGWAAPWAK